MDRDEVVRISRLHNFGGLAYNDISLVLTQYCLEHGKSQNETSLFVTAVLSIAPVMVNHCFDIALSYYEKKFTICKLYKILKPSDKQVLIQIF